MFDWDELIVRYIGFYTSRCIYNYVLIILSFRHSLLIATNDLSTCLCTEWRKGTDVQSCTDFYFNFCLIRSAMSVTLQVLPVTNPLITLSRFKRSVHMPMFGPVKKSRLYRSLKAGDLTRPVSSHSILTVIFFL